MCGRMQCVSGCGKVRAWSVDDVLHFLWRWGRRKCGVDFVGQVPVPFPAFVDSVCDAGIWVCVGCDACDASGCVCPVCSWGFDGDFSALEFC